jgi:hypothetical protein
MYSFGTYFEGKNTHLRESISVQCRVAVALSRLTTKKSLTMIGDVYGIGLNITSIIMKECCEAIRIQLRSLVFLKPTLARMKKIAFEFEAFA